MVSGSPLPLFALVSAGRLAAPGLRVTPAACGRVGPHSLGDADFRLPHVTEGGHADEEVVCCCQEVGHTGLAGSGALPGCS